jgi:hypothetical protein
MARKIAYRIGQSMFAGPPHPGEWSSRPARPEGNEPIATVFGRAKRRVGRAKRAECGGEVCGAGVRDVGADDRSPAATKTPQGAVHPPAQVAAALDQAPDSRRRGEVCPVWGHREHCLKAPISRQRPKQGRQRGTVEV